MNLIILILYTVSIFLLGWVIVKKWFDKLPWLLAIVGAFLLGTAIGVPVTYFLTLLFTKTHEPIFFGVIAFIAVVTPFIAYCLLSLKRRQLSSIRFNELLLVIVAIVFSSWLMTKTFHGGADGQIFVGSNNVFDFGHAVGLMRSISWGTNIPFASPFFSGLPMFYHFYFTYWTAIWEYFGVPVIWAVNMPSVLSFTSLLVVTYYLATIAAKQKPLVGWIAVALTITNSSLAFWYLLMKKGLSSDFFGQIWRLPTYPFAGPFDNSTISIFITLNNYVNQRHLAFVIAVGLFLFLFLEQAVAKKQLKPMITVMLGGVAGLLFFWNIAIWGLVLLLFSLFLLIHRQWKPFCIFVAGAVVTATLTMLPMAGFLYKALLFLGYLTGVTRTVVDVLPSWGLLDYLLQNLGLLPYVALSGFLLLSKQIRKTFFPFVFLFAALCVSAELKKRGFEQKFLSFLMIGVNILAAVVLGKLWGDKQNALKIVAVILFFVLTVSGVVDLMPIKNEFAYPLVSKETAPLISWIQNETPRDAVFVSYSDMIDPVVLSGRKNFFGFFGNVGSYDRSGDVARIYAGDIARAKANQISFILMPKAKRDDFHYVVNEDLLRNTLQRAYEDERHIVFAVKK